MIEVAPGLWVGDQADYEQGEFAGWAVVHAAKEPYHRKALGYTGRAAPKHHPEYLYCSRPQRLILNLVDAPDPKYVSARVIDAALAFIADMHEQELPVLVHCNQGKSRSAVIAMLAIAPTLPEVFAEAETRMRQLYPPFDPAPGMRGFAQEHWPHYFAAKANDG